MNWLDYGLPRHCGDCGRKSMHVIDVGGYEGGDFLCAECLATLLREVGYEVTPPKKNESA